MQLSRIGSQPRSFQRAIGEVCTLPLTPLTGGSKTKFVVHSKCATSFLCMKNSSYDTEHEVEFEGDKSYNKAAECQICGGPCGKDRMRGHCYLGGKFYGAARDRCSLN